MGYMASDVDPSDTMLSVLLVLPSSSPATSSSTSCGLQESWVWAPGRLVDQNVQGFLKDSSLWEFHLQKVSTTQLLLSGPASQPALPGPSCPQTSCSFQNHRFFGLDCPLCYFTQKLTLVLQSTLLESGSYVLFVLMSWYVHSLSCW